MDRDTPVRSPTLAQVIGRAMDSRLLQVHTCMPGTVTAYDEDKRKASVRIGIQNAYLDENDDRQVEALPVISGVPVAFLGAGGFRITCPISDGNLQINGETVEATTGTIFFADRSMDRWLSGSGQVVDPEIDHDHHLTDAIFVPGLRPFGNPLASSPNDHMTVGADAGQQIHLHADTICLGDESGSDFVALAQKVMDNLNALQTHFAAIEAVITGSNIPTVVGPTDGLQVALKAAITPSNIYPTPSDVAATVGKAK